MVTYSRRVLRGPMMTPESQAGSKDRSWGSAPMMEPQPIWQASAMWVWPLIQAWPPIWTPAARVTGPSITVKGPMRTSSASLASGETLAVG